MRIEGTYTFPAAIDRVFAALLNSDLLQQLIPDCERLIQLGPMTPEGGVTFELRLRNSNGPVTITLKTLVLRQPDHLRLELRGHAPDGPIAGQALIDLVEQETHTPGAYVLTLESPDTPPAPIQAAISTFCEHLANYLYTVGEQEREEESESDYGRAYARRYREGQDEDEAAPSAQSGAIVLPPTRVGAARHQAAQTSQRTSKITAWPRGQLRVVDALDAGQWRQRILWMGAGLVLGISIIGLAIGLMRWLGDHAE